MEKIWVLGDAVVDLLPDGEYDRVFSAADGPEIDDECLTSGFPGLGQAFR
mgnify:CR=1 FL=1